MGRPETREEIIARIEATVIPHKPHVPPAVAIGMAAVITKELICESIDPTMFEGVEDYINEGVMPGRFLTELFSNHLTGAFAQADINNRKCMFLWATFLHNHVPAPCWGSPEKMKAWKAERQNRPLTDPLERWSFKKLYSEGWS